MQSTLCKTKTPQVFPLLDLAGVVKHKDSGIVHEAHDEGVDHLHGWVASEAEGGMVTDTWQAPSGASITAVSADGERVLISLNGRALVALNLADASIKVQAQRELGSDEEVSCVTLSPSIPNACVAGFWKDGKVAFLDLTSLEPIAVEQVAEDPLAVPRSLTVANILKDQPATLFIGLADGNVVTYSIESSQKPFTTRKSIILGTQQPNFAILPRADGLQNVFATCEHPSLIYGSEGRMVYSAVTAENATCICSFDSFQPYGNAIAIATHDQLKIASVDEERTTHVQDLFVHETVRRIAYSADLKAFALGCIQRTMTKGQEEVKSHVKLVDEIAFKELDTWPLNEDELVEAVIRCKLDDGSGDEVERFVIGTAYLDEQDADQAKGRILVLEVTEDRRLKLVTELGVKGACRCLAICQGKIVAALVKTVCIPSHGSRRRRADVSQVIVYDFEYAASAATLIKKATYRTSTAPIDISVVDNIIGVTDLMKSMSLVEYKKGRVGMPDTLTEVARHFETLWGTALANVDEHTYLQSDAEGNLLVLQHNVTGLMDEDRRRLGVTSEMLLGEMVNRIRRVDVTPTPGAIVTPRAFLATVDGSIYLFALITQDKQDLLMRMQEKMAELVKSPGHVPFAKYRGFKNQVRDMGEQGPSRFVDGELIERFLDCSDEVQQEIVSDLEKFGVDVEDVRGMVESLRRIH